ncbi:MAG: hypothetical protein U5L05_12780 [Rubrivivax sp.]|nr:hypothetical protein [Rubrivivax sp.]
MIYTDTATERLVRIAARSRPSPIGRWFQAAWRQFLPAPTESSVPRDRARKADKPRVLATPVRQTEPHFDVLERVRLIKGIGATETRIPLQTYKVC